MTAGSVVERLDIVEDIRARQGAGLVDAFLDPLLFTAIMPRSGRKSTYARCPDFPSQLSLRIAARMYQIAAEAERKELGVLLDDISK